MESQQPTNKQKTFVFWKFTRSRFPEHVIYYIDICMKWLQFNKVYQRVYIKNSECLQLNHIYFGSNNGNYFNEKENKILMIDDRFHCCFLRSCSPTIFGLIGIFFWTYWLCCSGVSGTCLRVSEWQTNYSACPPVRGLLGQKKVLAHSSNHIASKVPVRPNYLQRKYKTTERTL